MIQPGRREKRKSEKTGNLIKDGKTDNVETIETIESIESIEIIDD